MSGSSSRPVTVTWVSVAVAACSAPESPSNIAISSGSAAFSLAGLDAAVVAIEYSVVNRAGNVMLADSIEGGAPDGLRFEIELPAGSGYTAAVSARTAAGQTCAGSSQFDVQARRRNRVPVELRCEAMPGQVSVVGTLTPEPECPRVEIENEDLGLEVGESLVLRVASDGALDSAPTWSAPGGELAAAGEVTRFTCTEPGVFEISLRASGSGCDASDSISVTCSAAPSASACEGLASTCHGVAETSDAANDCHEIGHAGDEAACARSGPACVDVCGAALCDQLASLCHDVDPGTGPLHECHELGHAAAPDACFERGRDCIDLCARAHAAPITLQFVASVGDAPFACGEVYAGAGSSGASAEARDFRFFVHDVRLIDADGDEVPVELDERVPWQARGVALLDFEDGSASCLGGDSAVNASVTGRAPAGTYLGLAFRVGVPEQANHADPALQPEPLRAGAMSWGWLSGYKFLRAELGAPGGGAALHLGATACSGDPAANDVACARSNRPEVVLMGFDPAASPVVADVGALFAGTDLTASSVCHSSGEVCEPMFSSLGLDLASGAPGGAQRVFRVEP